ncbi:oxysterol-binding protein-related protein 9 [Phlebotomus argentipes]|uniref:oxysterol-binding protein-related protein 9 n=1 Tax=Phlebotomus argentipes TaxID=94469 RepID=UPI002892A2FE|nr:oxysterol-binding protein-related protein 9 [Phlebotomus argentipes]
MSAMLEGTLSKWTNVMKGWQYRWFVLDENAGLLSYYTSKEKMMKGVRRGCVRLKGAIVGIDDQDVNTFTITVDHKTFHFQARDADEREKWVSRLEDTILRHGNRSRGMWEPQGSFHGSSNSSTKQRPNYLQAFDRKVSEADAYLQLIIDQTASIEQRIAGIEDAEERSKCLVVQEQANVMLDHIKHSIVLLQIAKNTAHPINGVYQGPTSKLEATIDVEQPPDLPIETGIAFGSECIEGGSRQSVQHNFESATALNLLVPETSYSSSEGEEDFYDANEDMLTCSQGNSPTYNTRSFPDSVDPEVAPNSRIVTDKNAENSTSTPSHERKRLGSRLPICTDGSLDYDALYEDQSDDDISMESHGSVVTHLLSQVKIGMDLTKVVLPTFILERRSLLEMYADYFAHPDLFIRIADLKDPRDRIVQVVKWYLSAYHAGRKSSVAKKPYNPILGEVFQCHWNIAENNEQVDNELVSDGPVPWCSKNQLTFVAEQVSHHPPISAFYAEHYAKKISFAAHVWTKSKFLGISIGVHNIGQGIVTLCDLNEEYIVTFPNGYGRSILTVPWIELGGTVTISCPRTGYHADVEFLTKPFYGGKKNRVTAEVFAPGEKKAFVSIAGEWSGAMEAKWNDGSRHKPEVFVDVNSIPIFHKNVRPIAEQDDSESRKVWKEVTAGLKLNDIERATGAKCSVEQKQRDEAKERKELGVEWENKYFKAVGENWIYTNPLSQRLYAQSKRDRR